MDIITLPVEYDKKRIESKYRLAVIASQRARELAVGAEPKVSRNTKRISTTSLIEILSGEITFFTGQEASEAREKADKIDFKKLIEDKRRPMPDLSEIEKDLKVYLHERDTTERALEELFSDHDDSFASEG